MQLKPLPTSLSSLFAGLHSPDYYPFFYQSQFAQLYERPPGTRLVINIGGRGSGKSYEVSRMVLHEAISNGKRVAVMRDEAVTIKESAMTELQNRFAELDASTHGRLSLNYTMLASELKQKDSNKSLIFTKGFRASSNDKQAGLKSIADIDIAYIEELEDLKSEFKFNQFKDSVRNKDSFIIVNLNIPDKNHWFTQRYFDFKESEHEGYYHLVPKKIEDVVYVITNYVDNVFLDEQTRKSYYNYGVVDSPTYDKHYYLTQMVGLCSAGRTGQIYTGWQPVTLEEFAALPYRSIYGLDFGTSSPNAIIECKFRDELAYYNEILYQPHLSTLDLAKQLIIAGVTGKDLIVADNAKPNEINQLRNGWRPSDLDPSTLEQFPQLKQGFNIVPCTKGAGSIEAGIKAVKGLKNHYTSTSHNLRNNELPMYVWAKDRHGIATDQPIDENNHLLDAIRYVVTARGRLF